MSWLVLLFIIAIPLAVTGGIVALAVALFRRLRAARGRPEELAGAAAMLGMTFSATDSERLVDAPVLAHHSATKVEHVISGSPGGVPVRLFDYCTQYEGDWARYSCAMTRIEASCPRLNITRSGRLMVAAVALAPGEHDIDFELPTFNDAFLVSGNDDAFAHAFVDQRMMQWLLSAPENFWFKVEGPWVTVTATELAPTALRPLLDTALAFHAQIPAVIPSLYPPAPR